jgi:hypothetical protein
LEVMFTSAVGFGEHHFQGVDKLQCPPYEKSLIVYCSKLSTGCNPHVLGWRSQPCVSSLQLDVGCPVVIATAISDAMLLPTDECFAQEAREPVYDGLTCPKYALWDSNPCSWLAKEQKSRFALEVGGYCSWTMRPGVVEMGDNNWLQDVSDVLITS